MYGGQLFWDAKWTPGLARRSAFRLTTLLTRENLSTAYDTNLGNTLVPGGTAFTYNFNPIVASGSVTYTLDSFPLYPGAFPIKLAGEYMNNPGAPSNNEGWWGGITLGKSGKKGTWDLSYRYQRLEADAWWDQIVDDDNAAAFPTSTPRRAGLAGGTNIKGHLVKFNYSISDSLTFSFTCYMNDLINNPFRRQKTDAIHVDGRPDVEILTGT